MQPVRVGVWGVGAWGEKHARVYHAIPEAELVGVFDLDRARAAAVAERHGARVFDDPEALLADVEAVSVAVPTVAHREAVERACAARVHVLVEKPMAVTVAEADAMSAAAQRGGVQLQVGQVERFNPALLAARPFVKAPKFIEAHRLALFQPRSLDIDVVFDLMIHDIDAVLHCVGASPERVSAVGVAVLSRNEDIANARLEFPGGAVANLTASRVSKERMRRIRFFQADAYVAVDLLDKNAEVLRIDAKRFRPDAPHEAIQRGRLEVGAGEPLTLELEAFVRSLRERVPGAAPAAEGREALRIAEEVRAEMKRRAGQWAIPSGAY